MMMSFFFQAEDGIRDLTVTGVQTCALPILFDLQAADAPGFIARLANRLHARTRAGVIRATLLVNPGDRYDSARVAESERALRNLYVFSRVRIDTTRLEGRLALRVATTDGWSTKPPLGDSSPAGDLRL